MRIIKTMHEIMKPSTLFNMTSGANRKPLRQNDASEMTMIEWVIFEDTMQDGTLLLCVSMKDEDGNIWTTNGATFVRDFSACAEACEMGGEEFNNILLLDRQSKKGRTFKTCAIPE